MTADAARIRAIAQLAAIEVTDAELPALTRDVGAILSFVEELNALGDGDATFTIGPERAELRPDQATPANPELDPGRFAPAFREGFFVVPKLGAMEP